MTAAKTDPDLPWIIAVEHYAPAHHCPRPALSLRIHAVGAADTIQWVMPGITWMCPECGLVYVSARTDRHTATWISTGKQDGGSP